MVNLAYSITLVASLLLLLAASGFGARFILGVHTRRSRLMLLGMVLLILRALLALIAVLGGYVKPNGVLLAIEFVMLAASTLVAVGMLFAPRIIYELYHTNAALEAMRADLEQRVHARTAELEQANQRLEAEMARREAADSARVAIETAYTVTLDRQPDRVCRYTPDGTITFVNKAFCDSYGKTREQLLGTSVFRLVPEPHRTMIRSAIARLGAETPVLVNEEKVEAGGEDQWESWTLHAMLGPDGSLSEVQAVGRDITMQRRAEIALRKHATKTQLLLERLPVMVMAMSADDHIVMWNRECERVTGYDAVAIVGKPDAFALLYPDPAYRKELGQRFRSLGNDFRDVETTVTCEDGRERVIAWSSISRHEPVTGWDRWVAGVDVTERKRTAEDLQQTRDRLAAQVDEQTSELQATQRDLEQEVIERQRAEIALRHSENQLRTTLDALADIVYVVDAEMRIVLCNAAFMNFTRDFGLETNPVGHTPFEVFPFLPGHLRDEYADVFASGAMRVNTETVQIGQAQIINETRKIPLRSGDKVTHIVTVLHDVSDQQHAAKALRSSEEKLRRLVDLSPDGIRLVDTDGVIVEWNRGNELITGIAREDAVGRLLVDVLRELAVPERRHAGLTQFTPQQVNAYLRGDDVDMPAHEFEIVRPDGEGRTIQTLVFPIDTADGRMAGAITRDVTERKRAEDALRVNEARYRAVSELVTDFAFSVGVNGDGDIALEWVTDAFLHVAGYTSDEVRSYENWISIIYPDDIPRFERSFATLRSGTPDVTELRMITRSGVVRWVRASARPVRDPESGDVVRVIGGVKDISEQKSAERARFASEQKFRRFIEESLDGIRMIDINGVVIEWNKANEAITGIARKDALGRPIWDIVYEQTPSHLRTAELRDDVKRATLEFLRSGKTPTRLQTYALLRPDGSTRHVQTITFLLETEQGRLGGAITRDVTDETLAQQALRENEQRLRTLIDATPDVICVKDSEGRWLIANEAYLQLFELTGADYVGKTDDELAELDPFFSEALASCRHTDEAAWQAGHMHSAEELVPRRDGPPRLYDVIKVPLFDSEGSRKELVVIGRDITERKRAEQQSLQLALERERSEIISGFIRDTSHEFANPLSVIKNNIYLALHTPDRERAQTLIDNIRGQVYHLEKLVEGLLTMSQLDRGVRFKLEPVDLHVLIAALHELARSSGAKKQLTITLEAPDELPVVLADQHFLHRALRELVANAIRYTPQGGTVRLAVEVQPEQVMIMIRDSGIGIAQSDLSHIFERFFRVDRARAERGAGLGLPIALQIMEQHGGTITVDSEPQNGTTFRVFLPIHSA